MADVSESLPLLGNLQGIIYLHRNHGSKSYLFVYILPIGIFQIYILQRMPTRRNRNKMEMALDTSHHHHLTCYIIKRHTEQRTITRLQTQEITSDAGRVEHPLLLYPHRLGLSRRSTGMHKHPVAIVIPFRKEIF